MMSSKTSGGAAVSKAHTDKKRTSLIRKIADAFSAFDAQDNNTCDIQEMGSIIRSLNVYPTQAQLAVWMQQVSVNLANPAVLEKDPFVSLMERFIMTDAVPRDGEELIFRAFQTLDVDKKGYLTPTELSNALKTGEALSHEEFQEMLMASSDRNDDKIYYEDYVRLLV